MISSDMAKSLHLRLEFIELVARSASHRYKTYRIKKRTGGSREINHPAKELKLLQRWLVEYILSSLKIHDSVYSYRVGVNIRDLALAHLHSNYLCRIDLKDYFPSIKDRDVRRLLRTTLKSMTKRDIWFISSIVCRFGQLTIGAPSSPIISNAIMYPLDHAISALCDKNGATYTRYADDLHISAKKQDVIGSIVPKIIKLIHEINSPRLRVNHKKTIHTSRKHRMMIAGLTISSERKISIGRERKREIKSLVFKYTNDQLKEPEIQYLRGMLAYIKSVEPSFIKRLQKKYTSSVIRAIINQI